MRDDARRSKVDWPAEARRPFRFVLLCHQRSGGNALAAILNDDPSVAP